MHEDIWIEDKIDREEEAEYLIQYLTKIHENDNNKSFVLNINSEWGFGKTYFLRNLQKELENKKHKVIYFDAWSNDYTKEPLLAFISKIDDAFSSYYDANEIKAKSLLTSVLKGSLPLLMSILIKQATGMGLDELEEYLEEDEKEMESTEKNEHKPSNENKNILKGLMNKTAELALKEHKNIGKSIQSFKINMGKLISRLESHEEFQMPLYVLIDELDRCRPNYAIELLENIKHLFEIRGLFFIVATDTKQLSHSINAIYGNKFKSERYLKRFFDKEYMLSEPKSYDFIKLKMTENNLLSHENFYSCLDNTAYEECDLDIKIIELYSNFFKLSLRDIEQSITTLEAIVLTWNYDYKIHLGYMIFLIMLKQTSNEHFDEYTNNPKSEDFINKLFHTLGNDINKHQKIYFKHRHEHISFNQLILEYSKYENMTFSKFKTERAYADKGRDNMIQKIKYGFCPRLKPINYDASTIIFEEFKDYSKYVLQGTRFI